MRIESLVDHAYLSTVPFVMNTFRSFLVSFMALCTLEMVAMIAFLMMMAAILLTSLVEESLQRNEQ